MFDEGGLDGVGGDEGVGATGTDSCTGSGVGADSSCMITSFTASVIDALISLTASAVRWGWGPVARPEELGSEEGSRASLAGEDV